MGHISIAGDKIYTYAVKQINTCHASTFSITDYYPFPRDHVKANSISKDDCVPNLIVTLKYTTMKNYLEPYKSTAICVNISLYIDIYLLHLPCFTCVMWVFNYGLSLSVI